MTTAGEPRAPAGPRFEFATAQRIIFGPGTRRELPALVAGFGRRVLLVTGGRPGRHADLVAALRAALDAVEILPVAAEPEVAVAEAGAARARETGCTAVVAIGGGSAIDAGKAIAALAANPPPALDYLEVVGRGQPLPHAPLPFLAVPTTAGTGAEVTRNAVLGVPAARVKVSLRSLAMLPRVALVDPELALGLPPDLTAATGLDALTQLIEPFLSCRANAFTDALCRDALPRVARALPLACREPSHLAARGELALGALHSGLALANAGLGAVHGFAAPVGGLVGAPHGAVCAALLPAVLAANLAAARGPRGTEALRARFDELGGLLTGRPDARADDAVAFCRDLAASLRVASLGRLGVRPEDLESIAAKAAAASSMKGNPVVLNAGELLDILRAALP